MSAKEKSKDAGLVAGLEVHVQLDTQSKLFCACPTRASEPNTATCPVCLGMPGSKPAPNRKAVEYAVKVALALHCTTNEHSYFSRKTYFYPDLAKNYQITQYESPIGEKGFLELPGGKQVRIARVHLEEDPAALVHEGGMKNAPYTLVDYNRSGIPLLEIVTEPDLKSPAEARAFLNQLLTTLEYLEVFTPGQNALKCDTNVSVPGHPRAEVKNVTSFAAVERVVAYEQQRQQKAVAEGKKTVQETRGFSEETQKTFSLRTKETEDDYGYIFDPDLPVLHLDEKWVARIRKTVPELHAQKEKRFQKAFGIPEDQARVLAGEKALSELFEAVARKCDPKNAANFMVKEMLSVIRHDDHDLRALKLDAGGLASLFSLYDEGKITEKTVKEALIAYVNRKTLPLDYVKKHDLLKDMEVGDVEQICRDVLAKHAEAAADFRGGNQKSLNFLVGQAMRAAKGKAEPRAVQETMRRLLGKK